MPTELWAVGIVVFAGLIGAFGPIFLKLGSAKVNRQLREQFKNHKLILGILIYCTAAAMFIPALKGGELSVLYPLVGLSYVWVCIYSVIMLKEKMTKLKWLGILTIILGVSLIGIGA